MNSEREISDRLLRLYPVTVIKDHFQKPQMSRQHMLNEITAGNTTLAIHQFAMSNSCFTRQHVFLYECEGRPTFNLEDLGVSSPGLETVDNGYTVHHYLVPVRIEAVEMAHLRLINVDNLWPVTVYFKNGILIIKITILERYLNQLGDSRIVARGQSIDETTIKNAILSTIPQQTSPIDLQKGIKDLLETEVLDCRFVKFKKDRSVSTETLDEDFTLKRDLPEVYADMMARPLEKLFMKYIDNGQEDLPTHFRIDPQVGHVSFSVYPPLASTNNQTLDLILANNS